MFTSLKVIGFASQLQSGKSTAAKYIAPKLTHKVPVPCHGGGVFEDRPWGRASFATEVKRIYCETFGKTTEFIEEWKVKDECPPGMTSTVRNALKFIGDGFRSIQPDIWIETAFRPERDPYNKVMDDLRYVNEARKIKAEGGLTVLLYREGNLNDDPNRSEAELKPYLMWCRATGKEGLISEWEEFKSKTLWLPAWERWDEETELLTEESERDRNTFEESLDYGITPDRFFDNLSQFDLFVRCENGVDKVREKVDNLILPYIVEHYPATGERPCT